MNVNALALKGLQSSIDSSTHEFREYYDIFFNGMRDTFRSRKDLANPVGPGEVRYRYVYCEVSDFGGVWALRSAYQAICDALTAKLTSTFSNFFAQNGFSALRDNVNISNSRFVGFLDELLTQSPFVPDGDEELMVPYFVGTTAPLVEAVYAAAAYGGIRGGQLQSTSTTEYVNDGWSTLFESVLDGLIKLRVSRNAGAGECLYIKAQSRRTVASMVYELTLEEVEFNLGEPFQTFSQAFQHALYAYSSTEEVSHLLRNDRVALKATLLNKGTEEAIFYKNGGPITYWSLGSLITI